MTGVTEMRIGENGRNPMKMGCQKAARLSPMVWPRSHAPECYAIYDCKNKKENLKYASLSCSRLAMRRNELDLKDIAALFFSTAALVISISNFVRSMWSARALRYLEINQRRLALVAKATVSEVASRAARRTLSNLQIEVARQGRLADFPELEDFIQSYTKQIAQVDKVKVELQKAVPTDPKSQAALEKVMDLAEAHFNSELSEAQAEDHAHLVRNNLQLRSA